MVRRGTRFRELRGVRGVRGSTGSTGSLAGGVNLAKRVWHLAIGGRPHNATGRGTAWTNGWRTWPSNQPCEAARRFQRCFRCCFNIWLLPCCCHVAATPATMARRRRVRPRGATTSQWTWENTCTRGRPMAWSLHCTCKHPERSQVSQTRSKKSDAKAATLKLHRYRRPQPMHISQYGLLHNVSEPLIDTPISRHMDGLVYLHGLEFPAYDIALVLRSWSLMNAWEESMKPKTPPFHDGLRTWAIRV